MPFTQTRILDLIEESERNVRLIQGFLTEATWQAGRTNLTCEQKLEVILGPVMDLLRGYRDKITCIERERYKHTNKRNARMRTYMQRRRGHVVPQFAPRAHEPLMPIIGSGSGEMITLDDGTSMLKAEFDAQIAAEMASLPPPNTTSLAPPESDALERELARARELGEQERAQNAQRLARDPFANGD